jgi:predicted ArsR family transcriptional regulator
MKQRLIQQLGRSARLKVINELKRTQGLGVTELAARLSMSYMGVKGICLDLEKRGLLDTWREPQKLGRPQMLYRLTERAHDLFPTESNALTLDLLESAQRLFGATAAEKLLLVVFQKWGDQQAARVKAETVQERIERLVRVREQGGYMPELVVTEAGAPRVIHEHHSPILDVLRAFPIVARLEAELFQRLLGVPVRREETSVSGLFLATFTIG